MVAEDPNAAGGTTSLAAAYVGVRHAMAIAGFENRQALRYPDGPIRISQRDHAAPPLVDDANAAGREHQTDRAGVTQQEIVSQPQKVIPFGGGPYQVRRGDLGLPFRLLCQKPDGPPLLIGPKQREYRQKDGNREQNRRRLRKESLQTQPEEKSNAAVNPGHEQEHCLHDAEIGPCDPHNIERLRVAALKSVEREAQTFADQVCTQEGRDAEAKNELHDLRGLKRKKRR